MSRSLITKREITEQDLLDLVGLPETDWIDFKAIAYGKDKKIELCKDVSSFANAEGGLIILGMTEEQGVATDLRGLGENFNADLETRHLSQVIENNIHPIIPGFRPLKVQLSDGKGWAIVLQIPRSPAAPHAIRVGGESPKFHIRRASKTSEMTYEELRMAFTQADQLVHRVKEFRKERIAALTNPASNPDVPVNLAEGLQLILHVVPLWATEPTTSIDPARLEPPSSNLSSLVRHFNIDGIIMRQESPQVREYYQFFRDGSVEYVEVIDLNSRDAHLPFATVERFFARSLNYILSQLENLEINPPLYAMITLNKTESWTFSYTQAFTPNRHLSPRDLILIPDVSIEQYPVPTEDREQACARLLRYPFDILWNTFGYPRSHTFDAKGNWSPPKR